jgi:membrane protease YdiL (CAAX protease family)
MPPDLRALRGKLAGWAVFVGVLALLAYAASFSQTGDRDQDLLFRWSTAVGGAVQYAIMIAVVLLLARGIDRGALGLRRPDSWRRAVGLLCGSLVLIWIVGAALNPFLDAGREQGLVPDSWDGSRAAPFAANFVVVAIVAPLVEELVFRGLGFAVVGACFGTAAAVVVPALAFGLAHGLVVALPVLSIFGAVLGWLRWQTRSLYPAIALHGIFNAAALVAAVTIGAA